MHFRSNSSSSLLHCLKIKITKSDVAVCRFKDTLSNTVGHRTSEIALQLGMLYNPQEALKIGMVDLIVPEDQVLTTAAQTMKKFLAIPGTF